eukprot:11252237-Heterocapsa_arctica.AAC.1
MFMRKGAMTCVAESAEVRESAAQRRVLLVGGYVRAEWAGDAFRTRAPKTTMHRGPRPKATRFR